MKKRIGILGAGAIGCYVGGRLIEAGHDVVMVGRIGAEIAEHGLSLSDLDRPPVKLPPDRVPFRASAEALQDREVVLVSVKSGGTETAGAALAGVLPAGATVVSLQNGVANAQVLARLLPGRQVIAGMVSFNVARTEGGHFHRGTSGPIALDEVPGAAEVAALLRDGGFDVQRHRGLERVQWSKLLFNLNNSINALAGVPVRATLLQRDYRRAVARVMREALQVLRAAGIRPARVGRMIPQLAPAVLSLPDALFFRVASAMISIDANARSSMLDDLDRRRDTEVDYLNGEIVRLGERFGVPTPVNRRVCELVHAAERARAGSPMIAPAELLAALDAAR